MGTFTLLNEVDLAAIATAFELGPVRTWRPIAAGTVNSNFAVETAAGRHFVRINEGKPEAMVAYEASLVTALAAAGVPTPSPLMARDGRRYSEHRAQWVSVFPWLPGEHRVPQTVTTDDCRALGRALASLHLAGLPLAASHPGQGIYTFAHIVARFESVRRRGEPALAPVVALLAQEIEWLEAHAAARASATRGIIHGDLFCDNVLFEGDSLVALIDFEQASVGSLAYDLAVCISDWCYAGGFRVDRIAALLAGYQTLRPLLPADRAALYIEARAAALRFTVTRITDVYLPGIDNPAKNFRDYLARLQSWRQLGRMPALASEEPLG